METTNRHNNETQTDNATEDENQSSHIASYLVGPYTNRNTTTFSSGDTKKPPNIWSK